MLLTVLVALWAVSRYSDIAEDAKRQLMLREVPNFELRDSIYAVFADSLARERAINDSLAIQTLQYENFLIQSDAAIVRSRIATSRIRAKRLNNNASATALDSILRNSDRVRRRLWAFRSDSVRYKDSLRLRASTLDD